MKVIKYFSLPDKSVDAMDVMILRFPTIAENIFGELDIKTITKCKGASRLWNIFLDEEKVQWYKILQKYADNMMYFSNDWRIVIMKTPAKTIKTLALLTQLYFEANPELGEQNTQMSPLSIAAACGVLDIYKHVSEKYKNIKRCIKELQPLCHAAANGRIEVCEYIIANSLGIVCLIDQTLIFRGLGLNVFKCFSFHGTAIFNSICTLVSPIEDCSK